MLRRTSASANATPTKGAPPPKSDDDIVDLLRSRVDLMLLGSGLGVARSSGGAGGRARNASEVAEEVMKRLRRTAAYRKNSWAFAAGHIDQGLFYYFFFHWHRDVATWAEADAPCWRVHHYWGPYKPWRPAGLDHNTHTTARYLWRLKEVEAAAEAAPTEAEEGAEEGAEDAEDGGDEAEELFGPEPGAAATSAPAVEVGDTVLVNPAVVRVGHSKFAVGAKAMRRLLGDGADLASEPVEIGFGHETLVYVSPLRTRSRRSVVQRKAGRRSYEYGPTRAELALATHSSCVSGASRSKHAGQRPTR